MIADKLAVIRKRLKMPALNRRLRNMDRIKIGVLALLSASKRNAIATSEQAMGAKCQLYFMGCNLP